MLRRNHRSSVRWTALVAACLLLVACSGLGKKPLVEPKVQVQEFDITKVTLSGIEGVVTLHVDNPNDTKLSAKELNYTVSVAGNQLVTGHNTDSISIPALGSNTIELPVQMSFATLIETFPKIMQSGLADYVIAGNIKTTFATVPFSKKGEFKLPFVPPSLKQKNYGHKI